MSVTVQKTTPLKKPILVYFLAVLFLLAPFGNIILSFAGSGIENWYSPEILFPLLNTVPVFEWIWLGLLFVTGLLLFRPHKLSWSVAIFTLVLILILNAIRVFQMDSSSINPSYLKVFSLLAILVSLSVLVVAFYFRFPYLDRRASWFRNLNRHILRTPVKISADAILQGMTESISLKGCMVVLNQAPQMGLVIGRRVSVQFMELEQITVEAEVVDVELDHVRLQFLKLSTDERHILRKFIGDQV